MVNISSDVIRGYNDTIILYLLLDRPSYGYEISKQIRLISEEKYVIKETTLYSAFTRLEKNGYIIKSLNTINFRKSMHYNPFSYIRSEKDILKLVNTIIVNTKGDGDKSGEDFWVKAEKLYYTALIGYIWYEAPDHEKNFTTLLEMINASEAREDDETFKNPVDVMFDELEARDPDHFAVKQYRKYKLAAGDICSK